MSATAKRRRGRPETPPAADYGPRARLDNGTAVLTYRADPDRPQAPAIRAARAFVAYDAMHARGELTDEQREAADRIAVAAECVAGATEADGPTSRAFWEYQGVVGRRLQAARDMNDVDVVLGRHKAAAVGELVINGRLTDRVAAIEGLQIMADFWGM